MVKKFKRHWHWYSDYPKFHSLWPRNTHDEGAAAWAYRKYLWAFWEIHVPFELKV